MSKDTTFQPEDFTSYWSNTLGPAHYAARRVAEQMFQGAEVQPIKEAADKAVDLIWDALYEKVEAFFLSDLECNVHDHICQMVDATIEALLTGQAWAMERYPYANYQRGEVIRAAVAKHGGEPLLMRRIADLEKELAETKERLQWAYDRR